MCKCHVQNFHKCNTESTDNRFVYSENNNYDNYANNCSDMIDRKVQGLFKNLES